MTEWGTIELMCGACFGTTTALRHLRPVTCDCGGELTIDESPGDVMLVLGTRGHLEIVLELEWPDPDELPT